MMRLTATPAAQAISEYRQRSAEITAIQDADQRRLAESELREARRLLVMEYSGAFFRRLVSQPADGTEALVWFWFNHFNVLWQHDLVGAALPSYIDDVLRPNAEGRFRDLLLGTMTHPAMLVYLDNTRNGSGKMNENYARELLELHTLGVNGGYNQADVRETARILTGAGLRTLEPVQWTPKQVPYLVQRGEFLFDPRRHDFGRKDLLGQTIPGKGFAELEALADRLSRHPATARHVAGKLCLFLVGEASPPALAEDTSRIFRETSGNLAAVLGLIRERRNRRDAPGLKTFKEPQRWVTSALALLSGGVPVKNAQLPLGWLAALGQGLFSCPTPDGYRLRGGDWLSAGQLAQRFELAPQIVNTLPRLAETAMPPEQIRASPAVGALEATLGPKSRQALARAKGDAGRLALLISSPEFMYW